MYFGIAEHPRGFGYPFFMRYRGEVAIAVSLYDPPVKEKGVLKSPQAFQNPKLKNLFSADDAQSNADRIPNRPTQQESCGLFYPFSGTKPTRSLTTSPPMIRPATEGTKALEPGTVRRAVHLRWVPGGQMQ